MEWRKGFNNADEETRIRQLIALKTFPNKWTGDEIGGEVMVDKIYSDGTRWGNTIWRINIFKNSIMRFIPILFSTQMVQALLKKAKTVTRRTRGLDKINENPDQWEFIGLEYNAKDQLCAHFTGSINKNEHYIIPSPYGQPRDILWVRESFCELVTGGPAEFRLYGYKTGEVEGSLLKWKPSIHMPKAACRLFLEITDIRAERLQQINEEDVLKEGSGREVRQMLLFGLDKKGRNEVYARSFNKLWQNINGQGSWDANPWVWVISFKRIDKPE